MNTCKKCNEELSSWSNFKDMEMKEGAYFAAFGSVFNGLGHMFWGNSRYKKDCDKWSDELYFCKGCKTYYIKCSSCNALLPLSEMPVNGKTSVKCHKCGKKILYAKDYNMGGA